MDNEIDLDKIDIAAEPPIEEPARQYYFMAKCREWIRDFTAKQGRTPSFFIQTFGCQMNAKDSEKLAGILEAVGFLEADGEDADFVLYNTCTVRENANQRVYGRLGQLGVLKKKRPWMLIALCGCMMQEKEVIKKLKASYPFVDLIFGTHNIFQLAELLFRCLDQHKPVVEVWEETDKIVEKLPAQRKYSFKSGVNIMFGCNNFCSYCIVPYVRGRERSRSPQEIIREIKALAADGVVEVMLLGQNVNSYGKTLDKPLSFARLLEEVEQVEGIKRIRFMTSHPKDLSDELIEVMSRSVKVCPHLHLPLQSGSSRILKEMNRKYTKEQYLALAEKIKEAVPGISLTTDIIVGFPGETEEDFLETLDVVEKVGFDSAFTFIYSKRTGTPAAAMADQVPEEEVKDRFERLLKRVQEIGAKVSGRHLNTVQEVLAEEVNTHDSRLITGRLGNNTLVHFPGGKELIGSVVSVYLDEFKGFYYMGNLKK